MFVASRVSRRNYGTAIKNSTSSIRRIQKLPHRDSTHTLVAALSSPSAFIAHIMKHPLNPLFALIALGSFSSSALLANNFDWPQWRGPDRSDVSKETGLLKSWPEGGPKRVWLFQNAGNGYSGPAIANGKYFVLGTRDGK